ncbi:TPA: hypothetical protein RZ067_003337 [Acinetobacter baumannii]|nr:hypothetical protein [Acinetobacter baumannii]HEB4103146.1 hypothetical protein [Acinetobacter baumannii]HEB4107199.1 hypothetical protein [Acinetobacter baumannii]HEG4461638.1 hypothetical protein [Acinetobacter baumannii]
MIVNIHVPRFEFEALKPFLPEGYTAIVNKDKVSLRIDSDDLILARHALHQQEQDDFLYSAFVTA